jgi:sugar/nucleoside kinase (ribokinase family)
LQRGVREQVPDAELVALDTMNLWIDTTRESLQKTIEVVDLLIVNDAEARQIAEEPNLIKAARKILSWGPQTLIVKRGEYGAAMFTGTNTLRFLPIHSNRCSIRPEREIHLPAG